MPKSNLKYLVVTPTGRQYIKDTLEECQDFCRRYSNANPHLTSETTFNRLHILKENPTNSKFPFQEI